jgi:hypothetical protein
MNAQSVMIDATATALRFGTGTTLVSEGFALVGTANTNQIENKVYNFRQRGAAWAPLASNDLLVPALVRTAETGSAVAIDGDTAVIGARDFDNRGAAFVFSAVPGSDNWIYKGMVQAPDLQQNDQFGASLALSGDSLIVGTPGKTGNAGAVYLYQRLGEAWTQTAVFGGAGSQRLGSDVDIFGVNAVAGAPNANVANLYAFDGVTWTQVRQFTGSGQFGAAVAIDQNTVAIGAPTANAGTGAAYVHVTTDGSTWSAQGGTITATGGAVGDGFGAAIDLSGERLLVGSPLRAGAAGAAYVFQRDAGSWTQERRFDLGAEALAGDRFGAAVAIDGERIVVGAYGRDHVRNGQTFVDEGEAFAWAIRRGDWQLETRGALAAADGFGGDNVGFAVALSGSRAIIGAPQIDGRPLGTDTDGGGYVYVRTVSPPTTVTVPVRQDLLIAGARANLITGSIGGTQSADLNVFDIRDITLRTGAGDDDITLGADGLTAFGLQNFRLETGGGDDLFTTMSGRLKPPAVGEVVPAGDFGTAPDGSPIPGGAGYQELTGGFSYDGGSGSNRLAARADTDWTLDPEGLDARGIANRLALANVQAVSLQGGASVNFIEVIGYAGSVAVDGAGGADQVTVQAAAMAVTDVADSGASGLDQLNVLGTEGVDGFLITADRVRLGAVDMGFAGIEVLRVAGGGGNDSFGVVDPLVARLVLDGEAGSDTYDIFVAASTSSVHISDSGPLPRDGGNIDRLNIPASAVAVGSNRFDVGAKSVFYDATIEEIGYSSVSPVQELSGTAGADTFILDGFTLSINGITLDMSVVVDLTLRGLGGDDVFIVIDTLPTLTELKILGGDGDDSLFGLAGGNLWTVTGVNAGTLSSPDYRVDFSEVETLVGGDGSDTFRFANDGARIDGDLQGNGGIDTLDFGPRGAAVAVDLGSGSATAIGGSFGGIETLLGSSAGDTLAGGDAGGNWQLTGVDAGTVGGIGFAGFEALIGGDGDDHFGFSATGNASGGVDGGAGNNTLAFTMTAGNDTVTVGSPTVVRNGLVTAYANIEAINVLGLDGVDDITVAPGAAGFPAQVNIDGGNGSDSIRVDLVAGVVTSVNVDGAAHDSGDTLTIMGTMEADNIVATDNVVTSDGMTIAIAGIEHLVVSGRGGDDSIALSGLTVAATVTLDGDSGDDTIVLNYPITGGSLGVSGGGEAGDTLVVNLTDAAETVTIGAAAISFSGGVSPAYSGFATLVVNARGGDDVVTVEGTHAGATLLTTGDGADSVTVTGSGGELLIQTEAGSDTVNVRGIGGNVGVDGGADGDIFNVSSTAPGAGGVLGGIAGLLTLFGEGGSDTVNIYADGDGVGLEGALTGGRLQGLGMAAGAAIDVAGVEDLNIVLGSGGDRFDVLQTPQDTRVWLATGAGDDQVLVTGVSGPTQVATGEGADNIDVALRTSAVAGVTTAISGLLTVDGGNGGWIDTLNVTSPAPEGETGELTSSTITGFGMDEGILYLGIEQLLLLLGTGDDVLTVLSTHAGSSTLQGRGGDDIVNLRSIAGPVTVSGGDGNDTVNVGSLAPGAGGRLDDIDAALTVHGGGGSDTLVLDNSGDGTGNAGTVAASLVTGFGLAAGRAP